MLRSVRRRITPSFLIGRAVGDGAAATAGALFLAGVFLSAPSGAHAGDETAPLSAPQVAQEQVPGAAPAEKPGPRKARAKKMPKTEPAAPVAQNNPSPPAAQGAQTGPAPPTPPPASAAVPQPVAHAAQAGIKVCLDGLVRSANATIDTTHTAMSQWSKASPDAHV